MHKKEKEIVNQISICPDTISDDHSTRAFPALILFISFLLIFDYQQIQSYKQEFLNNYGIKTVDETPEIFKQKEQQQQQQDQQQDQQTQQAAMKYLGQKAQQDEQTQNQDSSVDPNQNNPEQEQQIQLTEEQYQELYEKYKSERDFFQNFIYYFIGDVICVVLQYIFGSVSTYQNQNRLWLITLTLFIFLICGAYQTYRFAAFDFGEEYYIIFKFVVEVIILVYAIALFIKRILQLKKIYDLGDFYKQHQMVCYEYTFQKLFRQVSNTWDQFLNKKINQVDIEMYIEQEPQIIQEQKKIENNDYLNYSSIQILKDTLTPFSVICKRRIIGDFVYFPIKFLSAIFLAIFIYFYLLDFCIQMAKVLRAMADSYKKQLDELTEIGQEKPQSLIDTRLLDAFQIAFYITVSIEFIALVYYSFYLAYRYKKETVRLRRGIVKFGIPGDPYQTIKFYAFYCGNFFIAFFILTIMLSLLIGLILYKPFWGFVWWLIKKYYIALITIVVNIIIFKIFRIFTMDGMNVKRKRLLMAGEIFYIITGLPSVLTKGLIRVVMAMIGNLIEIFRVDKPVIGGYIARFDTAYVTYVGMILMNHYQNNPIVLTYIDLLEACIKQNKSTKKQSSIQEIQIQQTGLNVEDQALNESIDKLQQIDLTNTQQQEEQVEKNNNNLRRKRIINRFHLCVLLALNPSLCKYRKQQNNDKRLFETELDKFKRQSKLQKSETNEKIKIQINYNNYI